MRLGCLRWLMALACLGGDARHGDTRLFRMVSANLACKCLQRIGNYQLRDPLATYRSAHPL